jgi:hypothetical protein
MNLIIVVENEKVWEPLLALFGGPVRNKQKEARLITV